MSRKPKVRVSSPLRPKSKRPNRVRRGSGAAHFLRPPGLPISKVAPVYLLERLRCGLGKHMHAEPVDAARRRMERLLFPLLAIVIWPFIAIGVVAGWGFVVWMYYLFTGPPGPV